ncbi:UPF0764 protein C16orf89 homolog [Osmia bicornis bicornis]|uniref:UPF0764 protein C16orf89 homolog n=1 Tax=Osmia bicornis bicornis TaxID=1437191 RepID=UPI001EAF60BD|nr:UPF0764 protein C16orf89 homolog [Osmia bicornis bicornis]
MDRVRRFLSFWLILLFSDYLRLVDGKFVAEDFERNLIALSKVINYIHHRPHQMNADVTLSITIVEANIANTLLHKNAQYLGIEYQKMLMAILKMSDSTRRYLLNNIVPENRDVQLLHGTLNNPVLWMRPISWKEGVLKRGRVRSSLNDKDIRELIMQGTPKEEESDRCLSDIIRNKSNLGYTIPELCVDILMGPGTSRGYPLTHRLLIVQVAKAMNCDQALPVSSSELTQYYCSKILQDLTDIQAVGFPYHTPDLMMEQVLLCGMEGFLEFTDDHYDDLVRNWSHPSGCYSSFGNKFFDNHIHVSRRSSVKTDYGCDSHATGLAAATLSLLIRENVENAFN